MCLLRDLLDGDSHDSPLGEPLVALPTLPSGVFASESLEGGDSGGEGATRRKQVVISDINIRFIVSNKEEETGEEERSSDSVFIV